MLLTGCMHSIPFHSTPANPADLGVVDAVWSVWTHSIGGPGDTCEAQRHRLHIADLPSAETLAACNVPQPFSCFRYADGARGAFNLARRTPILVLDAGRSNKRGRLLVHEAVHWLGSCSGEGVDATHADPRYWMNGVQGDTDRMLGFR